MDPDGDPAFHRNEAISAVQDVDQYYGEDDDFDELYNDVNVGDGFLRSSHPPPPPQHAHPPAADHQQQQLPPPPPHLNQQQQQLPPPPLSQPQAAPPHTLPPPQQPTPHSLPPPPPHAPPQQKVYAPAVAAPGPSQPPLQPNLPPPPHPPAAPVPPPPQHHQIQQGDGFHRPGGNYGGGPVVGANGAGGDGPGGTTLFVGELYWWTTDADLEAELSKYGPVKEVRFFDEKASGKSKGYCQVDFYDPGAAAACKEGMNGYSFHGRPCVVAFASPNTVRRMGEAQVKNQQAMSAQTSSVQPKGGRGGGGGGAGMPHAGGNYSGGRGGGAVTGGSAGGNWGRGGGGGGGRGPVGNMRNNRMGLAVGRGIGNGMVAPPPPMLPQGGILGQGFDPTGYGPMGRMGGGFGNFPVGPGAGLFPGLMQPFPPVVAPHVNPAFFGRGGMGAGGVGMWPDPGMGGWGGEEQSNYGEDAASDHHYGEEGSHGKERPPEREWSGASERRRDREKDMPPEQEWPERRHRNERDMGQERGRDYDRDRERDRNRERDRGRDRERERDRERHRDDRDRYGDHHRHRDRDSERNEDWDRGRSSGIRSRSREADHSKRRRMTPQ